MSPDLPTLSDQQFDPVDNLRIIMPRTSTVWAGDGDGDPVTARTIGYHTDSQTPVWIYFQFRDTLGNPIDFGGPDLAVRALAAEVIDGASRMLNMPGEVIDEGLRGMVRVKFEPCKIGGSGVYALEFMVARQTTTDGVTTTQPMLSQRAYLYCEKSLFDGNGNSGPPPLEYLRMFLKDSMAIENRLIDRLMWDDAQISQAFHHVVNLWNVTPPLSVQRLTTRNIPPDYMPIFMYATAAQLYMLGHEDLVRNDVTTIADGMQLGEGQRKEDYLRLAQMKMEEFKQFAATTKIITNAHGFFRNVKSWYSAPGATASRGW